MLPLWQECHMRPKKRSCGLADMRNPQIGAFCGGFAMRATHHFRSRKRHMRKGLITKAAGRSWIFAILPHKLDRHARRLFKTVTIVIAACEYLRRFNTLQIDCPPAAQGSEARKTQAASAFLPSR
jgi:hypothetical protein